MENIHIFKISFNVIGYRKLTKMSHLTHSILLAQMIATFRHNLSTVALTDLADWSAFLELILLTI